MGWPEFHELCRMAGGVIAMDATATAAGLSVAAVRRRAAQEGWWRPFPGIAATPGTVIDGRARTHAAVLRARGTTGNADRDLAAATRWTAAYLLGVERRGPTRPQVTIPSTRALVRPDRGHGAARRDRFGYDVLRSNSLEPADVTIVRHVPTVVPARLVCDLAPVSGPDRLRGVVIDLVKNGRLSLAEVQGCLERRRSFTGRGTVRRVLADLEAAGRTDSPLEFEARRRFQEAGIPLDRGQVPVPLPHGGTLHCDLGILAIRFGIEVDSMAFHSRRTDLMRDASRNNAIMSIADTWRVVRVTWDLLHHPHWDRVLADVRRVVETQSRRYLGTDWPRREHLRG